MIGSRPILFIAAISIMFVANSAHAQPVNDIQCILVSNAFVKAGKDQTVKRVAERNLHFYFGRIDGRLNDAQLRAEFLRQQKSISQASASKMMHTCFVNAQKSVQRVLSVTGLLPARKR